MQPIEIANVDTVVGTIKLVTLRTKHLEVVLTSYGAGIFKLRFDGTDLAVVPEKLDDYLVSKHYYGKTIGRHSGRLFGPIFDIDGQSYKVNVDSNEKFQLHGGIEGLSFQNFQLTGYERLGDATSITFHYETKHKNDGFAGNLKLDVTYEVTKDDALEIRYHAVTSAPTICNITNHIYLNLEQEKQRVLNHQLYVKSDQYLDIDKTYRIKGVKDTIDTPFDFRFSRRINNRINDVVQPDVIGYDHCFLLNKHDDEEPIFTLTEENDKLGVNVYTDYPSVVLYTHNHPATASLGFNQTDGVHSSLAVECQYPPDGIHYESLNDGVLRPGEIYRKFIKIKPFYKK